MKYSPWGKVQAEDSICRGLSFVHTASHGGYMISKGLAKKLLSSPAQEVGMKWGGYLCYEEDCNAAIVDYELIISDKVSTKSFDNLESRNPISTKESIFKWNSEYASKVGLTKEVSSDQEEG